MCTSFCCTEVVSGSNNNRIYTIHNTFVMSCSTIRFDLCNIYSLFKFPANSSGAIPLSSIRSSILQETSALTIQSGVKLDRIFIITRRESFSSCVNLSDSSTSFSAFYQTAPARVDKISSHTIFGIERSFYLIIILHLCSFVYQLNIQNSATT